MRCQNFDWMLISGARLIWLIWWSSPHMCSTSRLQYHLELGGGGVYITTTCVNIPHTRFTPCVYLPLFICNTIMYPSLACVPSVLLCTSTLLRTVFSPGLINYLCMFIPGPCLHCMYVSIPLASVQERFLFSPCLRTIHIFKMRAF